MVPVARHRSIPPRLTRLGALLCVALLSLPPVGAHCFASHTPDQPLSLSNSAPLASQLDSSPLMPMASGTMLDHHHGNSDGTTTEKTCCDHQSCDTAGCTSTVGVQPIGALNDVVMVRSEPLTADMPSAMAIDPSTPATSPHICLT